MRVKLDFIHGCFAERAEFSYLNIWLYNVDDKFGSDTNKGITTNVGAIVLASWRENSGVLYQPAASTNPRE